MKLMIVDGNSILNRAYYGIRGLSAKDGTPTNAIYGFLNIFNKYFTEETPDSVAICFDVAKKTFRNDIYADYKGTRKDMDEELRVQLPLVKEILGYLGFKTIGIKGYEADDLIGTLSTAASKNKDKCVVITGDRDSLQLVDENVTVLFPSTKKGQTDTTRYTPEKVLEDMGVKPCQIVDLKALMGDTSDNIPGVAGIGKKGAADLISQFETLDKLYSEYEESSLRDSMKNKLSLGKESAYLSQTLATINREVPMDISPESYGIGEVNKSGAASILSRLGLYSIMEKYSLSASDSQESIEEEETREYKYTAVRENVIESIKKEAQNERIYYLISGSYVYAAVNEKLYITNEIEEFLGLEAEKSTYDVKSQYLFALRNSIQVKNVKFDLKLAAYLLEPTASDYELNHLKIKFGEPKISTDYTAEFGEDEGAFMDACALKDLCEKAEKELEEQNMTELLTEIELPLSETLSNMEFEGFSVDSEGLADFDRELARSLAEVRDTVFELAGCEFNLNSPKQLGEVLFEKLELPVKKKTKTGYSTNAEVLNELRQYHPIINNILEYRKIAKLKSTYTEGLMSKIGKDSRIHTTFLQTETRTGRLSSIEPNLQNIPVRTELGSRLREFFVAKEGYTLVDADYSQIELRVLAHVANDEAMIEAFRSGKDIHTATAARIHKLPIDMITPEVRRSAKAVNFGIVYGIGPFSLSQDIGTSVAEAKRLISTYLDEFCGVAEYMKKTVSDGEKNGFVETLYHRRRAIPELASKNKNIHAAGERVAMNTPIQGTAADIIKIAMNRVYNRLKKDAPESRLILQVHDELIVECPEKDADRIKELLREEMQKAASLSVELKSDVNVGKNWLIAKD